MAPSEYQTFAEVFVSCWPNEGADKDSDFVDNDPGDDQSDLSIDEGSITSGDRKVIAKGSVAGSDDEDNAGDEGAAAVSDKGAAAVSDKGAAAVSDEEAPAVGGKAAFVERYVACSDRKSVV